MAKGKKRGNGEGGISRRKDGRWEGRYYVETPTGEKRRSVYGRTRKEVAEKLAKAMVASKNGVPAFVPTSLTVGEFLAQYEEVAKGRMKRRGFETYIDNPSCPLSR